jgi:hypothetical protein
MKKECLIAGFVTCTYIGIGLYLAFLTRDWFTFFLGVGGYFGGLGLMIWISTWQ